MVTAILDSQFIQVEITFTYYTSYKIKLSGNICFAEFVADANLALLGTFFCIGNPSYGLSTIKELVRL